jgi:hypothetical protein
MQEHIVKTKQNKTKQNKTKQNKTKQNKTKQLCSNINELKCIHIWEIYLVEARKQLENFVLFEDISSILLFQHT